MKLTFPGRLQASWKVLAKQCLLVLIEQLRDEDDKVASSILRDVLREGQTNVHGEFRSRALDVDSPLGRPLRV